MNARRLPTENVAPGLAPLSVLPLFLRLEGKRAVVAGGNAGAAWKARLLAAAGAAVAVFAPQPSDEMREAAGGAVNGTIALHERDWTPDDLAGTAFAIAALDDEAACEAFVAVAHTHGAIANAVDRPHLCDVQFGAIVNRSPLVVGISTDGAAPVLGQSIRSAIEGLLPRGVGAWTAAAKAWRDAVRERIATFAGRRRFWEDFAARAMLHAHRAPTEADREALLDGRPEAGGCVTLVGAEPGDPKLLTLRAVRALRTADIILYDDLVAAEILDFARREAKTILVGKTGHGPSCTQDEICDLMVRLAREGRRVVRLKGGDPLIFGRAAEEIDACRALGIPVELVPGITSAQSAAASLGVSLTHRRVARRVQFVTGHDHRGGLPEGVSWPALADPAATTVVYMPRRTLARLVGEALAHGLDPRTPAVAVLRATRPDERVIAASIADLAEAVPAGEAGPMIVMIGEAMRLRDAHPLEAWAPAAAAG
ncbi:siroheme synthase CysG [Salinarimonas soli]|uniref:Uroporphyrinogen-III C-methyltransferase n=1 Tax=Salinarimonas soli TaxID=1638099 RepID=A0A5B2VAN7_9HYPH|nr:siroheme synthase CysG [Salinarimonas soli]KAA2235665.1 uroporphyrinogen-III C-methyltransferase [Salinarimonas soli]